MDIEIRQCDDWIVIYRDGKNVYEGHSCPVNFAFDLLGIDHTYNYYEWNEIDIDSLTLIPSGKDAFPEQLS